MLWLDARAARKLADQKTIEVTWQKKRADDERDNAKYEADKAHILENNAVAAKREN